MIQNRIIPLNQILPPKLQPRLDEDDPEIRELANSISTHGLISPLAVTPEGANFRLLAGNRRLKALLTLGSEVAPCRVIEADGDLADQITIAENLFRRNLSPIEEAYAFAVYLERTGESHDALAKSLGKERTYVTRRLLLLDLDDVTLGALEEKTINLSQAIILRQVDDPEMRKKFIEHTETYGANVRIMSYWVNNYHQEQAKAKASQEAAPTAENYTPPREIFMACDRCGEPTSYDVLRPKYLCKECQRAIAALRAAKAEAQ